MKAALKEEKVGKESGKCLLTWGSRCEQEKPHMHMDDGADRTHHTTYIHTCIECFRQRSLHVRGEARRREPFTSVENDLMIWWCWPLRLWPPQESDQRLGFLWKWMRAVDMRDNMEVGLMLGWAWKVRHKLRWFGDGHVEKE